LEWPRQAGLYHVINVIKLWFTENIAIATGRRRFRPVEPLLAPTARVIPTAPARRTKSS
jgi:hypothetical protein